MRDYNFSAVQKDPTLPDPNQLGKRSDRLTIATAKTYQTSDSTGTERNDFVANKKAPKTIKL